MRPDQKQIEEWLEANVTQYFLKLLKAKLQEAFNMRAAVFFPGAPYRTQEVKAHFLGSEAAYDEIITAMEAKDLSELEEPEDEKHIGNPPVSRPSVN